MIKRFLSNESTINSIIGENTLFKGTFYINGPLRIDGNFSGKINSTGKVIIGRNGRAECVITAKTVIIGGTVKGDVFAEEKVIILKSGEVIGNIYSKSITMDDGVIFNGKCEIIPENLIKDFIKSKSKEEYAFN